MNATEWTAIPTKLQNAGFTVSYSRISYAPENPLWRANAQRGEKTWNALGRDLESALVELEKQTQERIPDWRAMSKVP